MKQLIGLTILLFAITACGSVQAANAPVLPVVSSGGTVEDLTSLIDALRAEIKLSGTVEQEFFSVTGQIIKIGGVDVQVFEYETAEAMEAEASLIASDGGTVGTSMITWVDTPHFYKLGRLIVLYVGSDEAVLSFLEQTLGEQFAGR